ncbi:hypothetical protein ACHAWX_000149 [Stephanocyclus meneghinianus]
MRACYFMTCIKQDWIISSHQLARICVTTFLITSCAHGFDQQHHDITKVLRECGLAAMTHIKEFKATLAALLTLQEFEENKEACRKEVDPPVLTKSRIQKRAIVVAEKMMSFSQLKHWITMILNEASTWKRPKKDLDAVLV